MLEKKILQRIINMAYINGKGFCFYYNLNGERSEQYINTNDIGDYLPFLDYYGFSNIVKDWIESCLNKYEVFYQENVERFGSTRLSKYGVIDLYSNSDYFHGLLYIRNQIQYKEYFERIDAIFNRLESILDKTNYTCFFKILNSYIPIPIKRLVDSGMYGELFTEYGKQNIAKKIIYRDVDILLKSKKTIISSYIFDIPFQKESILMKDHTNLLFSYIRYFRNNKNEFKEDELKNIISLIIDNFDKEGVLSNTTKDITYTEPLVFGMFEVLFEAYTLSKDEYYLELIHKYVSFWILVLKKYKVLPSKVNFDLSLKSDFSIVDTNTDFYVFLKKINLFTSSKLVSKELLIEYKKNILDIFFNKETFDVYASYNLRRQELSKGFKSKFSCLFVKIFIADTVNNKEEYFKKEVLLDDR